jgi:hypothetical protein
MVPPMNRAASSAWATTIRIVRPSPGVTARIVVGAIQEGYDRTGDSVNSLDEMM